MLEPPYALNRALVAAAVTWAAELHGDQRREADHAAFILHPPEVAALLNGRGYDDEVVAAGVLHDSVENTDATIEDVRARFGDRCAAIVAAVSEDPAIEDYAARKAALRAAAFAGGPDVWAVYAADKVAKARELRAQAARDPGVLRDPHVARKLEHYDESLTMLRRAGGHPMVDQLAFELWALRTFPPAE